MPATNQWAVSMLIREVLADPDFAGRASCAVCSGPGRTGPVGVRGRRRDRRAAPRRARRSATASASRPRDHHRAGDVEPAIPKLRTGSFFPSLLHPRRRVGKALYAVICQAWIEGVPRPQGLATSCGPWATSPGSAAPRSPRSATGIDEVVKEFLSRRLDHAWFPYVFVDATYLDVRVGRRMVSRALVVVTGVSARGRREIPGMALGDAETVDFRVVLVLQSLRELGFKVPFPEDPTGVVLVTSDAHASIRAAVRAILPGAAWQRCRAPLRPHHHLQAGLGPIQASGRPGLHDLRPHQQGGRHRPVQARHRHFKGRSPFRIARMLIDAEPDPTVFATTPPPGEHRAKIRPQQPHRTAQPRDPAPRRRRPGSSPTASPHAP